MKRFLGVALLALLLAGDSHLVPPPDEYRFVRRPWSHHHTLCVTPTPVPPRFCPLEYVPGL